MSTGAKSAMQSVDIDGAQIAWTERGSGPPALFIHGSGTFSETFGQLLDELPEGIRAITYDRRGFAGSANGPLGSFGTHVDDAAALLEALDTGPATIVGSSAGGVLAMRLAVARPDLVSSLVLIEPAYQLAFVPSASAMATMARVNLRWIFGRDPKGAALYFYRWATSYQGGGNQFDSYSEEWRRIGLGHARAALRELPQIPPPLPTPAALRRVAKPTRVLIGNAGLRVFQRTARRALRAIPGAVEIPVPGAAHILYTDQPVLCAAAVADAVDEVTAQAGSGSTS